MTKLKKPFHASLIDDEAYEEIVQSCDFKDGVDLEAARFELGAIKKRYDEVRILQKGIDGQVRFRYAQQRDHLKSVQKFTKSHGDKLDDLTTLDLGDDGSYSFVPSWFDEIYDGIRDLEKLAERKLKSLRNVDLKKDLAWIELIQNLRVAYNKYTGKKATARRIDRKEEDGSEDPKNTPTDFQLFAAACAYAFGVKMSGSFFNDVQKAMTWHNNRHRKAKNPTKTP